MFLKIQTVFVLLVLSLSIQAEKILPLKAIKTIEHELEKKMNEQKVTKERRYYLYLLAGREFLNYRYLEESEKYYKKALKLNLSVNQVEIYISLISIAIRKNDKKEIKTRVNLALKYFRENSSFLNLELKNYLSFLKVNYLGVTDKREKEIVYKSFYGHYTKLKEIPKKIKKKQYLSVLSGFNPKGLEDADIGLKITYDVVNILVNKKRVKKLLCAPLLEKYPRSYSYSMKICKILKDYMSTGKVSKKSVSNLEKYFEKNHQDKDYLLFAVKDIGR